MKNILKPSFAFVLILAIVIKSDVAAKSAASALATCTGVLLPSLFPFFVLSKYFIKSGGASSAGKLFSPIIRRLFRINGFGGTAFLLGVMSGYPIGAKTAADLFNEGLLSKDEADRLICFCNNSGLLFIIGAVGAGMFASKALGIVLYVAHIAAAVTVGIILGLSRNHCSAALPKIKTVSNGNPFTEAVEESVFSLLNVFAYVIFFAVIIDIASSLRIFSILPQKAVPLVCSVFEVTLGIKKLSTSSDALSFKLPLAAFMLGWGGFSIHMQTKGVLKNYDFRFSKYLKAKLLHGCIAAVYTWAAICFIPLDKPVFSAKINFKVPFDIPTHAYFVTVAIFIYYIIRLLRSKCNTQHSTQRQKQAR